MSVTGYLALYTTLLGWQQYQTLWHLMVGVGLVFIPFIGIVLSSFLEPFESQEPKSAAVIALRRLMIKIVGALIIIEFCCVPTISLNPKVLHFEPACSVSQKVATPGDTGTTYDNQFKAATGVKVPVFWYLVMAISNGFTHAAIKSLSCSSIDYEGLQNQLAVSHISDAALKKETIVFYNQCYIPAYSHLLSGDLSDSTRSQIKALEDEYGKDDVAWIGSVVLQQTPGFYGKLQAQTPVPGFPFDASRDDFSGQVNNHSQWGQPSCKLWWTDTAHGLHARLQKALPPKFLDNYLSDVGIRNLIYHTFAPGMNFREIQQGYETLNDTNGSSIWSALSAEVGTIMHGMKFYPTLYLLINSLPVIQALLLLAIYALLALMIPFSSYRLHFIITGASIIFAITFWSYLWHWVHLIDNDLLGALYPHEAGKDIPTWAAFLPKDYLVSLPEIFVHYIIGALYVVLPLIFLVMATWAGLKVSGIVTAAIGQMQTPANQAGAGAAGAERAAMTAGTKLL